MTKKEHITINSALIKFEQKLIETFNSKSRLRLP